MKTLDQSMNEFVARVGLDAHAPILIRKAHGGDNYGAVVGAEAGAGVAAGAGCGGGVVAGATGCAGAAPVVLAFASVWRRSFRWTYPDLGSAS